ncbi:MAG: hypothetical protein JWR35_511 [Marmoricola sp.]|nr:hypothetical protein [Marmoricola sp.]
MPSLSADQELVAVVVAKHHNLEAALSLVEPEAQLTGRAVLLQAADEYCVLRVLDGVMRINAVPTRGVVNLHAT